MAMAFQNIWFDHEDLTLPYGTLILTMDDTDSFILRTRIGGANINEIPICVGMSVSKVSAPQPNSQDYPHFSLDMESIDLVANSATFSKKFYGYEFGEIDLVTDLRLYALYGVNNTNSANSRVDSADATNFLFQPVVSFQDPFNPIDYLRALVDGGWNPAIIDLPALLHPTDLGRVDLAREDKIIFKERGKRKREVKGHGQYKSVVYTVGMEISTMQTTQQQSDYGGEGRADVLLREVRRIIEADFAWKGEDDVSFLRPIDDGINISTGGQKRAWKYIYTVEIVRPYKRVEAAGP